MVSCITCNAAALVHYRRINDKANEISCTNTIQGSCAEFESLGEEDCQCSGIWNR